MRFFRRNVFFCLAVNFSLVTFHKYLLVDSVECTTDGSLMASIPGDITLGGLFTMFVPEKYGKCSDRTIKASSGVEVLEAILFSMDRINADKTLLPNITLGLRAFDTCGNEMAALDRVVKGFVLGVKCIQETGTANDKPVTGVLGPRYSYQAIHISPFLGLFQIPIISHSATSPALSDKSRYEYFSRTIPSDTFQGKVIIDILKYFNWTYVSIVYSDESYGRGGFEFIKEESSKRGICLGTRAALPMQYSKEYQKIAHEVVADHQAKAVVLFGVYSVIGPFLDDIQKYEASKNLQFIGSDGIIKSPGTSKGILFTKPETKELEEFNEYFLNLSVNNNKRNPWFPLFFQQRANCSLDKNTTKSTSLGTICDSSLPMRSVNYDRKQLRRSTVLLMIDAVYAFAHGLHFYQKNRCTKHGHDSIKCLLKISGSDLLHAIRASSFRSLTGTTVNFTSTGDISGAVYYVYFNHHDNNGIPRTIKIGEWREGLNFAENAPTSKFFQVKSQCGAVCKPGEVRRTLTGKPSCCWICVPCDENAFSINETTCRTCDQGFRPDRQRQICTPINVRYFTIDDDAESFLLVLPLIIVSALSILAVIFTVAVFIWFNSTPLVKASAREHSSLLLVGLFSSFLVPFASISKPSSLMCFLLFVLDSLPLTICLVAIAVKNNRTYRIFNPRRPLTSAPALAKTEAQIMISFGLISFQVLLLTLMIFFEFPHEKVFYPSTNEIYLICVISQKQRNLSHLYNVVLLIVCTYYAYKTKRLPRIFNDAKYIAFAMYGCCVIFVAFVVVSFGASSVQHYYSYQQMIACYRITFMATLLLICSFGPKVYIIVFKPEENRKQSMTERMPKQFVGHKVNEQRHQAQNAEVGLKNAGMMKEVHDQSTQTGEHDSEQYYSTKL